MAGPGGGPPRRSHTKSRKGCRMCKKRHIRCDENFPQCKNCTKHTARCDYMDMSNPGDEPPKGANPPDLLTTPQLQQALDTWRLTGESPLPELRKSDLAYWTRFSTIDLRLMHHITTLSSDMYRRGYSACTPWTPKMSNLLTAALSSDFTMNALLAMSAAHLAWQTKNSDTDNLAYHHRGIAIKGLHEALGTFSEQNSEAVLAASMLLSWQARDWQSWVSLQQGVSTVMNAMRPWMHQSELAKFLDSQRALARIRTPATPSISGLPPQQPAVEEMNRLNDMLSALHNLKLQLASFPELVEHVEEVMEYTQQIQQEFPLPGPSQAFDRLLQLRSMIFWLPTSVLSPESDLGGLAMLAHFLALALILEPLFPEIGGAYLGNLSLDPLEKVCHVVQSRSAAMPHDTTLRTALSMMDMPMQVALAYRASHRSLGSAISPFRHPSQSSHPHYIPSNISLPMPQEALRQGSFSSLHSAPSVLSSSSFMNPFQGPMIHRHDSSGSRTQSDPRMSTNSSIHSLASPHSSNESHSTNIDYFAGAASYQPQYGVASDYQNRQPDLSRSMIPPGTTYNTIPPPNGRNPHAGEDHEYGGQQHQARQNSHGWG